MKYFLLSRLSHTHSHRHTLSHTHTHSHRHTHSHTHSHTHIHTHIDTHSHTHSFSPSLSHSLSIENQLLSVRDLFVDIRNSLTDSISFFPFLPLPLSLKKGFPPFYTSYYSHFTLVLSLSSLFTLKAWTDIKLALLFQLQFTFFFTS